MDDKFTAGPWHWESDPVKNDPTGRIRYQVVATGKTITKIYYSSYEGGKTNAESDARLIAAAPDLLEALREAVDIIDSLDGQDNSCDPRIDITNLRSAIAKATGAKP